MPQKGFVISSDLNKNFVVRDGMVVDTNLMQTDADLKKAIVGKHTDHLTFYIHSFPIPKNGLITPLSFEGLETLRKQPNFYDNVSL